MPSSLDKLCGSAHSLKIPRTGDVISEQNIDVDFSHLQLNESLLAGLESHGFCHPSPIQLHALPLARIGLDLVVQAKSGTGKTLVYVLTALEMIDTSNVSLQAIVVVPTREIAVQGASVALQIGCFMPELKVHSFIGGISLVNDKKLCTNCHLAICTPGRLKQLLSENNMITTAVRLLVLDEADKLIEDSFYSDLVWIFNKLPSQKQILALSATYPDNLEELLSNKFMRFPTEVRLDAACQVLTGLRQFAIPVPYHPQTQYQSQLMFDALSSVLSRVSFGQCLVFCNYMMVAVGVTDKLNASGWPAVCLASCHDQSRRLQAMDSLKKFHCRIMLTTDLAARGIDAANVDLVINLGVPWVPNTYLHRIGRAGRYGSYGVAVTLFTTKSQNPEADDHDLTNIKGHEDDLLKMRRIVYQTSSCIRLIDLKSSEEKVSLENVNLWKCSMTDLPLISPLEGLAEENVINESGDNKKEKKKKVRGRKKTKFNALASVVPGEWKPVSNDSETPIDNGANFNDAAPHIDDDSDDLEKAMDVLTEHFKPSLNSISLRNTVPEPLEDTSVLKAHHTMELHYGKAWSKRLDDCTEIVRSRSPLTVLKEFIDDGNGHIKMQQDPVELKVKQENGIIEANSTVLSSGEESKLVASSESESTDTEDVASSPYMDFDFSSFKHRRQKMPPKYSSASVSGENSYHFPFPDPDECLPRWFKHVQRNRRMIEQMAYLKWMTK